MGEHWRKPKTPDREKPSPIAEVAAMIQSIFRVDWLPFDETKSTFRRRFAGSRPEIKN